MHNLAPSNGRRSWRGPPSAALKPLATAALLLLALVSSSSSAYIERKSGGRIQLVSVSAPWPTSCLSPLAEAAEFVAESADPILFWKYVEALDDSPRWVFSCAAVSGSSHGNVPNSKEQGTRESRADVADSVLLEGAVKVAVSAAGRGFGGEGRGVGMDDLSLGLMELALWTRCVKGCSVVYVFMMPVYDVFEFYACHATPTRYFVSVADAEFA